MSPIPNNFDHVTDMGFEFANDTSIAMRIRFVGASPDDPAVAIVGTTLSFFLDMAGTTKDTTIGVAGDADLSDAAYNTFAELLAVINASANWRAYLEGALHDDNTYASDLKVLVLTGASDEGRAVATSAGSLILFDMSNFNVCTAVIGPEADPTFGPFLTRVSLSDLVNIATRDVQDLTNPDNVQFSATNYASYASGYSVLGDGTASIFGVNTVITVLGATQTAYRLLRTIAGPAATVRQTDTFDPVPLTNPGERLVFRWAITDTTGAETASVRLYGAVGVHKGRSI